MKNPAELEADYQEKHRRVLDLEERLKVARAECNKAHAQRPGLIGDFGVCYSLTEDGKYIQTRPAVGGNWSILTSLRELAALAQTFLPVRKPAYRIREGGRHFYSIMKANGGLYGKYERRESAEKLCLPSERVTEFAEVEPND